MLVITKNKTTISLIPGEPLVATRLVNSTIMAITTKEPLTLKGYVAKVNNLTSLSNEDFELLRDIKDEEAVIS